MKSEHESDVEHVRRSSRQMSKNCVILLLKRDGSTTPPKSITGVGTSNCYVSESEDMSTSKY